MPIGLLGRTRLERIDYDDLGALALGLQDEGPSMQIRRDHVHAPHDDVLRVGKTFDVEAARRTYRHNPRRRRPRFAVGLLSDSRPETIEKRVTRRETVRRTLVA